jgi:hypothetical protein
MLKFPEQWGLQTRPADPETCTRKRRTKRLKPPQEVVDIPPEEVNIEADIDMANDTDMCDVATKRQRIMCDPNTTTETDPVSVDVPTIQRDLLDLVSTDSGRKSIPQPRSENTRVFIAPPLIKNNYSAQTPVVLNIQTLVSRLPYQQMLNQVFTDDTNCRSDIPVVTRAYEESFMREPMHDNERKCVCGDNCEFNFIDPNMPFVGVEFTLNKESSDTDGDPQMCILCSRRTTQEMFYNMVYNGHRFRGFIQRYGNLCQQPGEYARDAMLICPQNGAIHNMPLPIVAHNRHRYSVYSQNGTRYLRQHNVYYEDFHKPSSSMVPPQH